MDLNNNKKNNDNSNNGNNNNNNANENIPEPPPTPPNAQPQANAPGRVCPGAPVRRPRRPGMYRRNLPGVRLDFDNVRQVRYPNLVLRFPAPRAPRKRRKLQKKNCTMAPRALFKPNDDDENQDDTVCLDHTARD